LHNLERDAIILLREAFGPAWVGARGGGYFVTDFCTSQQIPVLRRFALESNGGQIATKLMRSRCNFFCDGIQAEGPGTPKRTRWHQEQPYCPVDGRQLYILWVLVDPVSAESSLECIRGSHRRNCWFPPELARNGGILFRENDQCYERMPDIEAGRQAYDIVFAHVPGAASRSQG
jgi:ectoine hydroxylase-related dioxygenase (phytanoyl-CoA dioxygenase family)